MSDDLHTKFRPTTFDEVIGQDAIVKSVKRVLDKKTGRAFIFTGPAGVGKTTLARVIGAYIGCDERNIHEVDAASNTGVDDMRRVIEPLQYALMGKTKVRVEIVDEAHMLSKQAWNSLLKSIEEPPPGVYWVLCTTEVSKIPKTIKTRCNFYDLRPVDHDLIYDLLVKVRDAEELKTDDDVLYLIAEKSSGSVRQALTGLSVCAGCKDRKSAAELLLTAGEDAELIEFVRALVFKRGSLNWPKVMKMLAPFAETNAESIRLTVVGYLTKVLLDCKTNDKATPLLTTLAAFADPYPASPTIAPVLLSVGELLFES